MDDDKCRKTVGPLTYLGCEDVVEITKRLSVHNKHSVTGNRTPVSRVTGGDTSHYTMTEIITWWRHCFYCTIWPLHLFIPQTFLTLPWPTQTCNQIQHIPIFIFLIYFSIYYHSIYHPYFIYLSLHVQLFDTSLF